MLLEFCIVNLLVFFFFSKFPILDAPVCNLCFFWRYAGHLVATLENRVNGDDIGPLTLRGIGRKAWCTVLTYACTASARTLGRRSLPHTLVASIYIWTDFVFF